MYCNSKIHSKSCPYNNALKGASLLQQHTFNQNEIKIVSNVLKISKYFITKNKGLFQQTDNILNEINQSLQILNVNSNQLKGASNICSKQSFNNIKNMVGLV